MSYQPNAYLVISYNTLEVKYIIHKNDTFEGI